LDGFNPNTYSRMVVMYVIMMKGMNTMNHDRRVSPPMHSWLSKMVNTIMTTIFKKALFCCPLNKSIKI
jgi:hypothetical protein